MLYVIMGGSNTGKDTIVNKLKNEYGYEVCVSDTTRPMRENEVDKISYNFITIKQFTQNLTDDKLIEHRIYKSATGLWYYSLSKDSVDTTKVQLVILDANGYKETINKLGEENVTGIYIYANEREKIMRALNREPNREDIKFYEELYRRMLDDLHAFDLIDDVYEVGNDDLNRATKQIDMIIRIESN